MSRKYDRIGNEFADTLRNIALASRSDSERHAALAGAWQVINTWSGMERRANPQFDSDRFHAFVLTRSMETTPQASPGELA